MNSMNPDRLSRDRPDSRERVAGRLLGLVNPVTRRLILAGMPKGAPNILLTVRGRRSGKLRTVPVGTLELDGRRFVQASYGREGWAVNLRATGEAVITEGERREPMQAVQVPPDQAARIPVRPSAVRADRGE